VNKRRRCRLEPDAVLGIAQLRNLCALGIVDGVWMDASALGLLLREAVQGEQLHIRMSNDTHLTDDPILVSSLH
jgi:hypothetical protein